ncbi:MAG: hypothetical protein HYY01_10575 [Chloroflexi bacterium]|nr:hypothetical protein [Chloroflexota bacterium]
MASRLKALRASLNGGPAKLAQRVPGLQKQTLTVSIQGNSLRIALLDRQKAVSWAHVPFNPSLLRNGFIANSQGMSQVVKNTLTSKGMRPAPAIASLPGFQSICRAITLPRAKDVAPAEVVPREARRLMAYSERDHYLFWQQVSAKSGTYLVVVTPRAPLVSLVETMKLAGLPLRRVELAPLALAKAVAQGQSIVANVESDSIDIVISINWVPTVVRSLWLGDEPLDVDSAPRRVAEELTRTISYHNDTNPDARLSPPQPIHLAGGFPIEELAPVVTQETGHPAVAVLPALAVARDFPGPAMAVNVGLGMH